MSASVASKNLFDLLGNDIEDPDAPPPPAPRQVIKNTTTSKKRDEKSAPDAAPVVSQARGSYKGRGRGGNDGAFRDREAGRQNNLAKTTDEDINTAQGGARGRGNRRQYDRHSQTGRVDTEKQVGQGWGANKGTKEWDDELAGAELAQKDAAGADSADPNAVPSSEDPAAAESAATVEVAEEPEEVHKTYDEYLAELAQRQADLGPPAELRRPNEGGSDKKWAAAKELSRKEGEEGAYFIGESKDKARNRERKTKQVLDIEHRYVEPRDAGRGGPRGGRGRGGDRGGRGRGERSSRGDRGGGKSTGTPNLDDASDFPSLGK